MENIMKKAPIFQESLILRMQRAADYLSVSRAYLYIIVNRGELTKIKLGGRAAGIRRADLDAWVDTQAAR